MSYRTADATFQVQVSATKISTLPTTPTTTLNSSDIGLEVGGIEIEEGIREIDGYYTGIRNQENTKKRTGSVKFKCDLNDTTKALAGKWGQFLYFKRVVREGTAVEITELGEAVIMKCNIVEEDNVFMIDYEAMITRMTTTVA